MIQLFTCDLLLSLRTALWQKQASASQLLGETYHASGTELAGFQRDLGSLRTTPLGIPLDRTETLLSKLALSCSPQLVCSDT